VESVRWRAGGLLLLCPPSWPARPGRLGSGQGPRDCPCAGGQRSCTAWRSPTPAAPALTAGTRSPTTRCWATPAATSPSSSTTTPSPALPRRPWPL